MDMSVGGCPMCGRISDGKQSSLTGTFTKLQHTQLVTTVEELRTLSACLQIHINHIQSKQCAGGARDSKVPVEIHKTSEVDFGTLFHATARTIFTRLSSVISILKQHSTTHSSSDKQQLCNCFSLQKRVDELSTLSACLQVHISSINTYKHKDSQMLSANLSNECTAFQATTKTILSRLNSIINDLELSTDDEVCAEPITAAMGSSAASTATAAISSSAPTATSSAGGFDSNVPSLGQSRQDDRSIKKLNLTQLVRLGVQLIRHAQKCSEPLCIIDGCSPMKVTLAHLACCELSAQSCPNDRCQQVRPLVKHIRDCCDSACDVCVIQETGQETYIPVVSKAPAQYTVQLKKVLSKKNNINIEHDGNRYFQCKRPLKTPSLYKIWRCTMCSSGSVYTEEVNGELYLAPKPGNAHSSHIAKPSALDQARAKLKGERSKGEVCKEKILRDIKTGAPHRGYLVRNQRCDGGSHLHLNGFAYKLSGASNTKVTTTWGCIQPHCSGKVVTDTNIDFLKKTTEHLIQEEDGSVSQHVQSEDKNQCRRAFAGFKQRCKDNPRESTTNMVGAMHKELGPEARQYLPPVEDCRRRGRDYKHKALTDANSPELKNYLIDHRKGVELSRKPVKRKASNEETKRKKKRVEKDTAERQEVIGNKVSYVVDGRRQLMSSLSFEKEDFLIYDDELL